MYKFMQFLAPILKGKVHMHIINQKSNTKTIHEGIVFCIHMTLVKARWKIIMLGAHMYEARRKR